ncbi:MFS transporter [Ketogulonicigenium vulgare]|uniref:MFS transporter n=1 Tax=Ketogulonicigenium vulgare TaxID=92945 RepID=UPI002359DF91|nr:MFS transporter [Ketogulonicigenium vulgare]
MPAIFAPAIIFGCNAILFVTLFSRLPDLAANLSLDKGALGTIILCSAVGGLLSTPLANRIAARLTPPLAATIGITILSLVVFLMSFAPIPGLVLLFFVMGANNTVLEVSQNLVSLRIEADSGKKVLARSHGFWSAGMILGSAISAGMQWAGTSAQVHMGAMALLAICAAWFGIRRFAPKSWPAAPVTTGKPRFAFPNRFILLLCVTIWGLVLLEGAAYDWGIFFLREVNLFDPATATLVYGCMSVAMFVMRMTGDSLRSRISDGTILRGAAVAGILAIILLLASPTIWAAALAFVLLGFSAAMVFPVAVAIANARSGLDGGDGIAALAATLTLARIGIPPLFGWIAQAYSLQLVFGMLIIPILVTILLAPRVTGRT